MNKIHSNLQICTTYYIFTSVLPQKKPPLRFESGDFMNIHEYLYKNKVAEKHDTDNDPVPGKGLKAMVLNEACKEFDGNH